MIAAITGELRSVETDRIHLACGDVVYEIFIPAFDAAAMNLRIGQTITLHTIFDLEGDASRGGLTPRLIGFTRLDDKKFFQLFITVKGIGPKRALRALTHPIGQIADAIETRNVKQLTQLPEVGKRTAEQMVAELAGKVGMFAKPSGNGKVAVATTAQSAVEQMAIDGLMQLGIPRSEAERLLDRARLMPQPPATAELLLREMLRLRTTRA